MGGVKAQFTSFLTLAPDGGQVSVSGPPTVLRPVPTEYEYSRFGCLEEKNVLPLLVIVI
jgi:hypothetical protein